MGNKEAADFLRKFGKDKQIIYLDQSSATVPLAALALGVPEGAIAKSLALEQNGQTVLLVVGGAAKIDNAKYKQHFSCKAKMLGREETELFTGHPVGGVCPFGLPFGMKIFLDKSLKQFDPVYPAAGSGNSAIGLLLSELAEITGGEWVDVCKPLSL